MRMSSKEKDAFSPFGPPHDGAGKIFYVATYACEPLNFAAKFPTVFITALIVFLSPPRSPPADVSSHSEALLAAFITVEPLYTIYGNM
jgi:hypothetical protein